MKKVRIFLFTAVMAGVMLLGAGCGKEKVTAEGLIQQVSENMNDCKSIEANMKMDFLLSMPSEQEAGDTNMNMDADLQAVMDSKATEKFSLHMDGKIGMEVAGATVDMAMEAYIVPEDDELATYTGTQGIWVREAVPISEENSAQQEVFAVSFDELAKANVKMVLDEEKVTVGDKSCYKLTMDMNGRALQNMLNMSSGALGDMVASTDSVDFSKAAFDYVLYIDEKAKLPVKAEMDATEMMNTAFQSMGVDTEDVSVEKYAIAIEVKSYDSVDEIKVPDEVKTQAVTASETAGQMSEDIGGESEAEETIQDTSMSENGEPIIYNIYGDYRAIIPVPEGMEIDFDLKNKLSVTYFNDEGSIDYVYEFSSTLSKWMQKYTSFARLAEEYPEEFSDVVTSEVYTTKIGDYDVQWYTESYVYEGYYETRAVGWIEAENDVMLECDITNYYGEVLTEQDIIKAFENVQVLSVD